MAEIKWIKITTDMFEDEKIDYISSLPEGDAIILIWVRLLLLAGKANASGWVMLTESIPYDDAMIANKFRKPINTVRFAIETFVRLGMIEYGHGILVANWEKHQNIEGLEKIREQNRIRKQNERDRNKALLLQLNPCHVTVTSESQRIHAIEGEEDKELDLKENSSPNSINNDEILNDEVIETVHDVHTKVFGTIMMSGVMSEYITKLKKMDVTDSFIKEAMREAGESSPKANLRYFKKIVESWIAKGIKSREEALANLEQRKKNEGDSHAKHEGSSQRIQSRKDQRTGASTQGESKVYRSKWDDEKI